MSLSYNNTADDSAPLPYQQTNAARTRGQTQSRQNAARAAPQPQRRVSNNNAKNTKNTQAQVRANDAAAWTSQSASPHVSTNGDDAAEQFERAAARQRMMTRTMQDVERSYRVGVQVLTTLAALNIELESPEDVKDMITRALRTLQCRVGVQACPWRGAVELLLFEMVVAVKGEPGTPEFAAWLGQLAVPMTDEATADGSQVTVTGLPEACRVDAEACAQSVQRDTTCTFPALLEVWAQVQGALSEDRLAAVRKLTQSADTRALLFGAGDDDGAMSGGTKTVLGCLGRGLGMLGGAILGVMDNGVLRYAMGIVLEMALAYRDTVQGGYTLFHSSRTVDPPSIVQEDGRAAAVWACMFPPDWSKKPQAQAPSQRQRTSWAGGRGAGRARSGGRGRR